MLNTVENSRAKKTAGLAVTYRAAGGDMFGTCPDSCALKPTATGTHEIDRDYEAAVRRAVPRRGLAFLFTHFPPEQWAEENQAGRTTFNYSADTLADAARCVKSGTAAVAVVPADYWTDRASAKVTEAGGVKMVRCPNETTGVDCARCGNGVPLCARPDRKFAVLFTAHGASKRKAGDPATPGGCYAAAGNVAIHWRRLSERLMMPGQTALGETDAEHVRRFASGLAPRSVLRHHIAGDIGTAPGPA